MPHTSHIRAEEMPIAWAIGMPVPLRPKAAPRSRPTCARHKVGDMHLGRVTRKEARCRPR
jgi:hypothetical protein